MSMENYPVYNHGVLVTPEIAAWIALAFNRSVDIQISVDNERFAELAKTDSDELRTVLNMDPDESPMEYAQEYLSDLNVESVNYSFFDGIVRTIAFPGENVEEDEAWEKEYSDADLILIPLEKSESGSLFDGQTYTDGEEIIQEIKNTMNGILPDNFNYRSVLVSIFGFAWDC